MAYALARAKDKRENYPAVFKIASKSARLKSQGFELRWGSPDHPMTPPPDALPMGCPSST